MFRFDSTPAFPYIFRKFLRMAKTEVILIKNVVGLGGETDQVAVAAGYARNYLIPQGLAVLVSSGNRKWLDNLKKRRAEREAHELNTMAELGKSLSKVTVTISVKTGEDGKLFGSVTNGSISDALKTQLDVSLDKKKIHLEKAIHALGDYEVELRLHPEVQCTLKVVVKSSNPLPEPSAADAKGEVAAKSEKRGRRVAAGENPGKVADVEKSEKPAKEKKSSKA
jgi:large subunit ribosomal protein L9